jgi:hypothetical protein
METPFRDTEPEFTLPEFSLSNNDGHPEPDKEEEPTDAEGIDWSSYLEELNAESPASGSGGGGNKPPQEPPTASGAEDPGDLNRWANELNSVEPLLLDETGQTKQLLGGQWEAVSRENDDTIIVDEGGLVVTNEATLAAKIEPGEYGAVIVNRDGPEIGLVHFDHQEVGGANSQLSIPKFANFVDSLGDTFGGNKMAVVFSPSNLSPEEIAYHANNLGRPESEIAQGTSDRIGFWGEMIKDAAEEKLGAENVAYINHGQLQIVKVEDSGITIVCNGEESNETFIFEHGRTTPEIVSSEGFSPKAILSHEASRSTLLSRIKDRDWLMSSDGETIPTQGTGYDLDLEVNMDYPQTPSVTLKLTSGESDVAEISGYLDDKTMYLAGLPEEASGDPDVNLPLTLVGRMRHLARGAGCDSIAFPDARSVWEARGLEGEVSPEDQIKLLEVYDATGQQLGFFHDGRNGIWHKRLNFGTPPDML